MVGWYVILSLTGLVIAAVVRFGVYMVLVKSKRWLPEKATKMADMSSGLILGVVLLAIVGKAIFTP